MCVGRMVQRVSSLFVVLGTSFIPFRTKWRGANLFSINMLSRDFFFIFWIAIHEALSI